MPQKLKTLIRAYIVVAGVTHQTAVRDLRAHESLIRSGRRCCYHCPPDLDVWESIPAKENSWQSERGICRVFACPVESGMRWFGALYFELMPDILNENYATARDAQLALVDERRRRAGCSSVLGHRLGRAISYYEFARDEPDAAARAHRVWAARKLVEAHKARQDACGHPFDLNVVYAKHRARAQSRRGKLDDCCRES